MWAKYSELLQVVSVVALGPESRKFVCNIRFVAPFYHATILEYLCITRYNEPLKDRQHESLRHIITIAFKAYKHEGNKAILRMARPLFMAVLESDDMAHKGWALTYFQDSRGIWPKLQKSLYGPGGSYCGAGKNGVLLAHYATAGVWPI
ncbi:hypothetical protein OIDMADRAFT_21512 [Oidiodendron maius Zn]|uniref:Uncharacterized protein n=1 Tax=Oidiodendron maius (strain Zn) TaxID=913774 RepID=A0A0C3GSK6_OIDMZ|nr:hypothetical protein OIDMADRAFT_21512 [Oidiodendron maius Zn]